MQVDPPHYRVIYDVATESGLADWWFLPIVVGMLCVLVAILYRRRKTLHAFQVSLLVVMTGFLACMIVAAIMGVRASRHSLRHALATGRYTLVEGRVRDFEPDDPAAHRPETWAVESGGNLYRYEFNAAETGPGFHKTSAYGGSPIYQTLRVRIADVDGIIARLEIAE